MASWKLAAVLFLAASQPWTLVQGTNINLRPNGIDWQSAAVDDRITLQIGLNESNYDRFVNELQKVSDPRDPSYGKHWSREKVRDLTVPSSQVRTKVKDWLVSKGFHTVWDDGSWFILNTTIGIANRKFNMTFDQTTVNGVLRTRLLDSNTTYGAPPDVRKEIELIWPFIYSGDRTPPDDETPGSENAVIRYNWPGYYPGAAVELYNTEAYQPRAGSKSKLGFPSFQLESADRTKRHPQYFRLPHDDYTRKFMDGLIDYDCGSLCLEASNLDKQGAVTVAESLPIIEYVFGGLSDPLPLLDFLLRLSDQKNDKLPQVMFMSYGVSELDVPPAWAKRVCYLMGKLALRGVSFVVASGDHGAGKCKTTDGQNDTVIELSFPATCPWVTAVGATRGSFNDSQEAAGESGGGFSNLFPRPDWQESAVSNYLAGQGGAFVPEGRGYPDVSAPMSENTSVSDSKPAMEADTDLTLLTGVLVGQSETLWRHALLCSFLRCPGCSPQRRSAQPKQKRARLAQPIAVPVRIQDSE